MAPDRTNVFSLKNVKKLQLHHFIEGDITLKVSLWLLDINYEVRNNQPEIWLWGLDQNGKRLLVIDKNFEPYFYATPKKGVPPQNITEQIRRVPNVKHLEIVERRYFGKKVKALKVFCTNPEEMPKCAKNVKNLKDIEECFEDDIRYSMRYLIDKEVSPCSWHEIEVERCAEKVNAKVDDVYFAVGAPKHVESTLTPQLRILAFSIICYSAKGEPKPEENPVAIISTVTNDGKERQLVAKDNDDRPVLEGFVDVVQSFDPDIIVGFGSNRRDLPYLKKRCEVHGIRLKIDRMGGEPHTSVYGHVSITGRANIDLFDFADEFPDVKVKTLENLADYLGVMKRSERVLIEDIYYAEHWEDPEKRKALLRFSMENARSIMGITNAVLDFAMQLSSLVGLPLDHIETAAVGFRVEWFLIKHAHKIGELVPKRKERPYLPYVGAIVLPPKPGIHEKIAVLDFKAMYPNIMVTYNLSPDTYIPPDKPIPPGGVFEAPEVGHRFRKEPPGFYKEVLTYLVDARDKIRAKLKTLPPESVEYRVLDARQKAVKIIANATYGYAGWIGARWYIKPVAEAATAWGRSIITSAVEIAEKLGVTVIYGDTDSLFVKHEDDKITKLSEEIGKRIGLEIKPEKIYTRILFTEAKKRYCGLLPNGQLDIVGLEVIRGDWATVAKNVQHKILEIILKENSAEKAVEYVRRVIREVREKKVPYRDLIIWKSLTRPIEAYAVRAAHVEAAKLLQKKGWKISVGDKIGYVIVSGEGKLYERAKPYVLANYDEIDTEYYVEKQILPVASRILEMFNVKKETLLASAREKKKEKLTDFFKA